MKSHGHNRDLAGLVFRGVGWMGASQGATQLLGFVTSIIIARFLSPFEVGLAAEALVFGTLALVIVDFGFGAAIIQRPNLTQEDKSTAFWAGIVLALALTALGIGLSWPIASLYGEPEVQPLFAVLSLSFLFTAPGIVQGALLIRELEFRSLEVRTIIATTASALTAMTLAVAGAGSWAIVVQNLVITSVSTALLWRASDWRPSMRFSRESLRSMASYTTHIFGTRMLEWGTINVDNFLVGRFVGTASLGAYSIAFSTMVTPLKRIAIPVTQVFFPAFSKMRDPERIAPVWLRAVRVLAVIVVPSMLGLIAVAPDFVVTVFGEKWHEAIPVMQILAPVGLIQALMAINSGVLQALARTQTLFRFTVVLSAATVLGFVAGLPWGIEGVATAYLIVTLTLQPFILGFTARAVGRTPRDWLASISGVLQAGLVMLAVVLGLHELLRDIGVGPGGRLVIEILVGALVYVPMVLWRAPEIRSEVATVRERMGSRAAPEPEELIDPETTGDVLNPADPRMP